MTILIAVATTDTVVLVADGRHRRGEKIESDDERKIFVVSQRSMLAVSGAVPVTSAVAAHMTNNAATSMPAVHAQLTSYAAEGMSQLLPQVAEGPARDGLRVGLIVVGFDQAGAYLVSALATASNLRAADVAVPIAPEDLQVLVLGGETAGATAYCNGLLQPLVAEHGTELLGHPVTLQKVLDACLRTIQYASKADASIGGAVRYRVLHRTGAAQEGVLAII